MIVSVGEGPAGCPSPHVMDLRGYLLLPSLVEPHAHLRLTASVPRPGEAGGRAAADRDRWVAMPADLVPTDVATLAWNGAARYLAAGTTAIRVHVDVGQEAGLRAVGALLEVRAGLAGILDIQIVAAASASRPGRWDGWPRSPGPGSATRSRSATWRASGRRKRNSGVRRVRWRTPGSAWW